ncbi:MAG TPA: hypothetical protein VFK94_04210 [Patescibacteria group bacterium]|nr:hypothetical protein [Patescibacteria group bacterium]
MAALTDSIPPDNPTPSAPLTQKQAWAMVREITNRLDVTNQLLRDIDNALDDLSPTPPSKTSNPQDVSEPPDFIHLWVSTEHHSNPAVLQMMMNALIANGDLNLIVEVGTTQYRGVLMGNNMHATTVLTRTR